MRVMDVYEWTHRSSFAHVKEELLQIVFSIICTALLSFAPHTNATPNSQLTDASVIELAANNRQHLESFGVTRSGKNTRCSCACRDKIIITSFNKSQLGKQNNLCPLNTLGSILTYNVMHKVQSDRMIHFVLNTLPYMLHKWPNTS